MTAAERVAWKAAPPRKNVDHAVNGGWWPTPRARRRRPAGAAADRRADEPLRRSAATSRDDDGTRPVRAGSAERPSARMVPPQQRPGRSPRRASCRSAALRRQAQQAEATAGIAARAGQDAPDGGRPQERAGAQAGRRRHRTRRAVRAEVVLDGGRRRPPDAPDRGDRRPGGVLPGRPGHPAADRERRDEERQDDERDQLVGPVQPPVAPLGRPMDAGRRRADRRRQRRRGRRRGRRAAEALVVDGVAEGVAVAHMPDNGRSRPGLRVGVRASGADGWPVSPQPLSLRRPSVGVASSPLMMTSRPSAKRHRRSPRVMSGATEAMVGNLSAGTGPKRSTSRATSRSSWSGR